jgi:hypothetical protein
VRILLTNNTLSIRAGSELYIRDVALALLANGHQPIAYSRDLGDVARELRNASVLVIDDLSELSHPPDIIHAQHHLEAMTALTRYPNVPAVYVCHGWLPPQEAPPQHPRIYRYLAVDELVQLRLVEECGLPQEIVHVCHNFVDLTRFRKRRDLPEKAQRALAFSNYINDSNVLPILREACEQCDIELDVLGSSAGKAHAKPEEILGEYDIVFAKGRAALEAAAVGAAVIVCDAAGIGEMTSLKHLSYFRAYNFGLRLLRNKITVESVKSQIDRYSAADTNSVTNLIRADIGLDLAVEKLVEHYHAAIKFHQTTKDTGDQEARAVSAYLRHGPICSDFSESARAELNQQVGRFEAQARFLETHARAIEAQLGDAKNALNSAQLRNQSLEADILNLQSELKNTAKISSQKLTESYHQIENQNRRLIRLQNSFAWRLRTKLVGIGWIQRIYRAVFTK